MPFIAWASQAGLGAYRAGLGLLSEYPLGLVVVDHCYRITALALRRAIDARRQVRLMLGLVRGLRYFRLSWENACEAIFPTGEFNVLRKQRPRNQENQCCR